MEEENKPPHSSQISKAWMKVSGLGMQSLSSLYTESQSNVNTGLRDQAPPPLQGLGQLSRPQREPESEAPIVRKLLDGC